MRFEFFQSSHCFFVLEAQPVNLHRCCGYRVGWDRILRKRPGRYLNVTTIVCLEPWSLQKLRYCFINITIALMLYLTPLYVGTSKLFSQYILLSYWE
jgi:hypothetical protein